MHYRKFGNTDLLVSETGFGAWAIGGNAMIGETAIGWGEAKDEDSEKAIRRALDIGINFFDTADIYGLGHSEELIGKLLGRRKEVLLASKVGNVSREGQFTFDYSKKYILGACENSLRRLRREYIDYYQLHSARLEHLRQGECLDAMEVLQRQGKLRYWGLSLNTFDPVPEAEYLMANKLGSGFQLVLNLLNQKALPLIEKAASDGFGIIARMPLQFGLLTGKFDESVSFSADDHRQKRLTLSVVQQANKALQPVWELCDKYQVTKTQLALSYVLSYDAVSTVIPGIRTVQHVNGNALGLVRLDETDRQLIEELGRTRFPKVMKTIQQQG